jgi:hypothetical protein
MNYHRVDIAMLLNSVQTTARLSFTTFLVQQAIRGVVRPNCYVDQVAILAYHGFDKVAAIIILSHIQSPPAHCHMISLSYGANFLRLTVQGRSRQLVRCDGNRADIPINFDDRVMKPAVKMVRIQYHPIPLTIRASTVYDAVITLVCAMRV